MLNFIANWRREREAVRELSRLSDRELADLGIARADIRAVAEGAALSVRGEAASISAVRSVDPMALSWGGHNRRSLAA